MKKHSIIKTLSILLLFCTISFVFVDKVMAIPTPTDWACGKIVGLEYEDSNFVYLTLFTDAGINKQFRIYGDGGGNHGLVEMLMSAYIKDTVLKAGYANLSTSKGPFDTITGTKVSNSTDMSTCAAFPF